MGFRDREACAWVQQGSKMFVYWHHCGAHTTGVVVSKPKIPHADEIDEIMMSIYPQSEARERALCAY